MGNKRNKRENQYKKQDKTKPKHDKRLSTQPIRPMPHAKIKRVQHTPDDRQIHRNKIAERKLAKWQKALLDDDKIATNWLGEDGKHYIDFR